MSEGNGAAAQDPRADLQPKVTVEYADHQLTASWPALTAAFVYHVEVKDPSGAVVHIADLDADSYAPPVVLQSAAFTPLPHSTYTVEVAVRGMPSVPVSVTALDLGQPVVTGSQAGGSVHLAWSTVPDATAYDLQVARSDDGHVVVDRAGMTEASADIGLADGLVLDTPYRARVRARAGAAHGSWSDPFDVVLPSAAAILGALADRLAAARLQPDPGLPPAYPLNGTTLLAGASGQPERVLAVLDAALAPTADAPLAIASASGPVLDADKTRLTLSGTARVFIGGCDATAAAVVFTVSEGFRLQASWSGTLPDLWWLSEAHPVLIGSPYQYLPLRQATYHVSTYPHLEPEVWFPLGVGLHYQAGISIDPRLLPDTGVTPAPEAQTVRVGGPVGLAPDRRPEFSWTGQSTLGPLTVTRTGQTPLILTGAAVTLASTRTDDPAANDNLLTLKGTVDLAGHAMPGQVDLPTVATSTPALTVTVPQQASADAALQALAVNDALSRRLPPGLLAMAGVEVTCYRVQFDPSGVFPTRTTVELGFGSGRWQLLSAPVIALSQLKLVATVSRSTNNEFPVLISCSAEVRAGLQLGGTVYQVRAGIPACGPWYLEIQDSQTAPALGDLSELVGLTPGQVTGVLPGTLLDPGSPVRIHEIELAVDPFTPALERVRFTLVQSRPWSLLGGAVTLQDWSLQTTLLAGPGSDALPQVSGLLLGSVAVASGAAACVFDAEIALPPGPDRFLTVGLRPGYSVHLPTIGQVLGLLGAAAIPLPAGVATLGDLNVTALTLSLDPATLALKHVALGFDQSGTWTVIPGTLSVKDLSAAFMLDCGTSPVGTFGNLHGTVTVAGEPLDLRAVKSGYGGGWTVSAGAEHPVHVGSFAALAADLWLSPEVAAGSLPDDLPLSQGFDIGPVILRFAPATGALAGVGFTIATADLWTVVPGRLSLTDVRAQVELPYPVVADKTTADISGLLTIAGVRIRLSAARPLPGGDWEFTGSLVEGVGIDLKAAADAIAGAVGLALPADITEHGFPRSVDIVRADLRAKPHTGLFHLDGQLTFDWTFSFGASTTFTIRSLTATLDVPGAGAPATAAIRGELSVGDCLDVGLSLSLGGPGVHTVLTGTVTGEAAGRIRIDGLADQIVTEGGDGGWATIAPNGLARLGFADAAVLLDLTEPVLLLYGSMTYGGTPAARGVFYVEHRQVPPDPARWNFAVAVGLGPGFRFGALVPALAPMDSVCQVTDARLIVCRAGEDKLGALAVRVGTALHTVLPSAVSPLDGLSADTSNLTTGAFLTAVLEFGSPAPDALVPLFSRLLQIGTGTAPAQVLLSALLDHDEPSRSCFTADLPDITIAGTVQFTHDDTHPGIHLAYTPADASRFSLEGRVALLRIFGSDLRFDVRLTVDDDGLTTTVRQTSQSIDNPFGLPGIVFSGLGLDLTYTWAEPARGTVPAVEGSSRLILTGHTLLGPAPQPGQPDSRLSVQGRLALSDGHPVLLYLGIDADFSIVQFLAQCLSGSAASWPSTFIDLTLLTDSRIYYYDSAADPAHAFADYGGFTFTDGFHIDARIRLTLVAELTVRGLISVVRDPQSQAYSGVQAAIALEHPVDLVFAQLAGDTRPAPDDPYTGGPTLALETGTAARLDLSSGINFFGAAFAHVDVGVTKDPASGVVFTGRLEAGQRLEPFGKLSCRFRYETIPGRFTVLDWPAFDWARNLVDFVKGIRSLCATGTGSVCGQLASLIVENLFDTSFSLEPAVSSSGEDLVFGFTGTYQMTIVGATKPFLTAKLPAFAVHVPKSTQWSNLPGVLAAGIGSAAETFARDLLADPSQAALFLGMVFGPRALTLGLELACNGLVDGAVAGAADAAATAVTAAGGATAAGAGVAAAAAVAAWLPPPPPPPVGGKPQQPVLRSAVYENEAVTAVWDGARNASGYTFEVQSPDGESLASHSYGYVTTGTLPIAAAALAPGVYQARVRSVRGDETSDWGALPLAKPATPQAALGYRDGSLVLTWTHPGADEYAVVFLAPSGFQIGSEVRLRGVTEAAIPLPEPAAGTYRAKVRALLKNNQFPGDWSAAATLTLLSLPAPMVTSALHSADEGTITVRWRAGAANLTHQAVARTADGAPVADVTAAPGMTSATLPAPADGWAVGTTYTLAVRATGPDALSPWSTRALTIFDVPAPQGLAAEMRAAELVARWDPVAPSGVAGQVRYEVTAHDASQPAVVVGRAESEQTEAVLVPGSGRTPSEGDRYMVSVRAVAADNAGPWSTAVPFDIHLLPSPAQVSLTIPRTPAPWQGFSVAWTAPTLPPAVPQQPLTFAARLCVETAEGWIEAGHATALTGDRAQLERSDGRPPAVAERYLARVQSHVPMYSSDWAASNTVTVLDTVPVTATYAAGRLEADWPLSAVPHACYQAVLSPPAGEAITVPVPAPTGQRARVSFDLTGMTKGGSYGLMVRVIAPDGTVGPDSPPIAVAVVDPPEGLSVNYDGGTLWTATWDSARGATTYHLVISDAGDQPLLDIDTGPGICEVGFDAMGLPRRVPLDARVSTLMGSWSSEPSAAETFFLVDPPTDLTAEAHDLFITVNWTFIDASGGYDVRFSSVGGVVVVRSLTPPPMQMPYTRLERGMTYSVDVHPCSGGPWSEPVTVTVPEAASGA
ncbi:hypothetical protein [Streptomyces sp. NPDC057429]|uniref:hypothetical protein n=1 Tax=Streptomyces sp. NPDC057429 TaxID=3346130 RepID=UPI00368BF6EE